MIPIPFLLNVPVSSLELSKPKIELVSSYTTIENNDNDYLKNLNRLLGKELNTCDYLNYIGTTITSTRLNKFVQSEEFFVDFYTSDYDVTIKMPKVMIVSKKVKIKSISNFKPRVIF